MFSKILLYTKAGLFLIRERRNRRISREPCKYFFSIYVNDGSYLPNLLTYLGRSPNQASQTFHRFLQALLTGSRYVVPFNVVDRVISFLPLLTLPTVGCHKRSFEAISFGCLTQ